MNLLQIIWVLKQIIYKIYQYLCNCVSKGGVIYFIHPQKKSSQKMEPQQYFTMAFPRILGTKQLQTKDSISSLPSLFEHIKQYIMGIDDNNDTSIIGNCKQVLRLQKTLTSKDKCSRILPIYEAGCAVVLEKKNDHSFTHVFLVYCVEWDMEYSLMEDKVKVYNVPLDEFNVVCIGEIPRSDNLQILSQKYFEAYSRVSKRGKELASKNNLAMPNQTIILCRKALEITINQKKSSQKERIEAELTNQISKCETINSNFWNANDAQRLGSLKCDTIWAVQWAVIFYFARDQELVKALIADYRSHLLKKYCENYLTEKDRIQIPQSTKYLQQKSSIITFTSCLQSLHTNFQSLLATNNTFYIHSKAHALLLSLAHTIYKMDTPCTELSYDLKEMGKHFSIPTFKINVGHLVPGLIEYSRMKSQNMRALTRSYVVNSANPIEDLISKYFEKSNEADKSTAKMELWILAVEDTMFSLAFNQLQLKQPFKTLSLSLLRLQQATTTSQTSCPLTQLFHLYSSQLTKNYHKYTMTLECQAYSHIELMKALIVVIGFEVFKRERVESIYDIREYVVPVNYREIYKNFNSISYKARRAMEKLYEYCQYHSKKVLFFDQRLGYQNYKHYAERVAVKSQPMKNQFEKKKNHVEQKKSQLREKLKQFHKNLALMQQKLKKIKAQRCECYEVEYEQDEPNYYGQIIKVKKKKTVVCNRCENAKSQQEHIQNLKKQEQVEILTQIPQQDGLIHQFFYMLEPYLEGLLNLILMCQHETNLKPFDHKNKQNTIVVYQRDKIRLETFYGQVKYFKMLSKKQADVDSLIKYSRNEIDLYWKGCKKPTAKYNRMSQMSNIAYSGNYQKFTQFLQNPISPPDKRRQHEIYAKKGEKPSQIQHDQFIAIGSCRVGHYTQLPMVLEGLLNRTICVSSLSNDYQYKLQIVYRSLSAIQAARPKGLGWQINDNIWNGSIYYYTYFLNKYYEKWQSEDYNSLPLIGPLLSLMSRTVTDDKRDIDKFDFTFGEKPYNTQLIKAKKVIKQIMKKIKAQYQRLEQDIKSSSDKQASSVQANRQNQYFICFGGICCFTQMLLNQNDKSNLAVQFVRLIAIMKFKQVYLGTSKKKSSNYMEVINKYDMFKTRAIENNIKIALKYFEAKPKSLTQVVQVVDEGIDKETEWFKDYESEYLFKGKNKWGDQYKIDIKVGKIIKNGQSISRVPDNDKKTDHYKRIFETRDFEVFPSPSKNSFHTKRNFIDLFIGNLEPQDSVLFQFAQTHSAPTINLIFRYHQNQQSETWRLLDNKQLTRYVQIPKIYTQNYYAWYSAKRSCIVLRQPNLQRIGQVALVAFIEQGQSLQKKITHIHVISKQHYRANLDQLCDPKVKIFDKLILRKYKESLPYQILSRVEQVDYILELETYETKERKFWLHRYDSMFVQDQKHGILPQSFKNYRISQKPYSHPKIPWTQKDKISCLVLQKYTKNQSTQHLHNTKILIPEWLCDENGRIAIPEPKNINETTSFYVYDIHDHFSDMRGMNRVSQIHIASILAAINRNLRHSLLKFTPIEYALKIMKSCFNNCPLTGPEIAELKNILAIASCQQNQALLLVCYALFKCTIEIDQLKQSYRQYIVEIFNNSQQNEQIRCLISSAMSKYTKKLQQSRIPFRQQISTEVLAMLGVPHYEDFCYGRGRDRVWRRENGLRYRLPELAVGELVRKYEGVMGEWAALNAEVMGSVKEPKKEEEKDSRQQGKQKEENKEQSKKAQKQFPLQIQNPEQNTLLTDVLSQLQHSHKIHKKVSLHFASIKIDKKSLHSKFKHISHNLQECRDEINQVLGGLTMQNWEHVDVIVGGVPVLARIDYVGLLIEGDGEMDGGSGLFQKIFRDFQSQEEKTKFKKNLLALIRLWMLFCIKLDSCQRTLIILKHELQHPDKIDLETDKIALFRQCESPRPEIEKRVHWICFQTEMKMQIWKSQYQTFETLFVKNKSGSISQLNMGQGKTQTIIPMMTLQLLYGNATQLQQYKVFSHDKHRGQHKIPRINFMQALINESKYNYFRFLSITSFNIPIVILPFDRKVDLRSTQNFQAIVRSFHYFYKKMLILVDQSSTHSLMLKLREETIRSKGEYRFSKEQNIFNKISVFDIFDEVDAQLTPKKEFIYSIGKSSALDELDFRATITASLLETICIMLNKNQQFRNYFTFDETQDDIQRALKSGQFPKGLRLISDILGTEGNRLKFRKNVFTGFLKNRKQNDQYHFLEILSQQQLAYIIEYITNDTLSEQKLSLQLTTTAKNVIYIFRGLFAYGILEHCLSQRCNVNYGIPDQERKTKKRLAVPYEAADIPSKKNDYAHPDVAIMLSYLAYYNFGLTEQEVVECLERLFKLTQNNEQTRNAIFTQWVQSLSPSDQQSLKIANTLQIQLHSSSQLQRLYSVFHLNCKFITYWLRNCVYFKDMTQFKESITSSSWDHANVKICFGFSGTKDNCRLLPSYVELVGSDNMEIMGTDGKMLEMLIENVVEVRDVKGGGESLWERFLMTIFELPKQYTVASIIDAGAVLASKPLKDHIVPWISKYRQFNPTRKFKGILFCSDNIWKVYKLSSHEFIDRNTSIPDNETFVIFDEYRTRGADVKMDANIAAVLTLNSNITKDSLMQAVGRLRKIGRNQRVVILMTEEVKLRIRRTVQYKDSMSTTEKVKAILSWSCINSVRQNQKYFLPNAKLARIHFSNTINPRSPHIDVSDTSLKTMYSQPITYKSIYELCEKTIDQLGTLELTESSKKSLLKLRNIFHVYGQKRRIKSQNFDEVCERQTQLVTQMHEQITVQKTILIAIPQTDQFVQQRGNAQHNFRFSPKFTISRNFRQCTESLNKWQTHSTNQLMTSFFILLSSKSGICLITQRQAYTLMLERMLPVYQTDFQQEANEYVARLGDLWVGDEFVRKHRLQEAYVHCKFYNGCSNFEMKEEQRIMKSLLKYEDRKDDRAKYFLDKRRQAYKFKNSSLEKIYKDILLIPENFNEMVARNSIASLELGDVRIDGDDNADKGQKQEQDQNQEQEKQMDKRKEEEEESEQDQGQGQDQEEQQDEEQQQEQDQQDNQQDEGQQQQEQQNEPSEPQDNQSQLPASNPSIQKSKV